MSTTSWGTTSGPAPPPTERSPPLIRVLLVGDDPLARGGLAYLLSGEPGLAVVAQTDALGAAAAVERDDPQVAVWDLGAEPLGWLERLGDLGESGPPALALLPGQEAAPPALAAGARRPLFRPRA